MCLLLSSSKSFLWPGTDSHLAGAKLVFPRGHHCCFSSMQQVGVTSSALLFIAIVRSSTSISMASTRSRCFWAVVCCAVAFRPAQWIAFYQGNFLSAHWSIWLFGFITFSSQTVAYVNSCSSAFLFMQKINMLLIWLLCIKNVWKSNYLDSFPYFVLFHQKESAG